MNALVIAGSAIAILTYLPLWKQIRAGSVHQNMLTWGLWGTLDALVAATVIVQHGSWLLPVAYTIGGAISVVIIARSGGKPAWTWFETMVSSLVVVCAVVWYLTSDAVATVAATSAMLIAGIPQLKDAWRNPREMPIAAYVGYSIANILCTAGAADWSIKERFYPACASVFCLLFVALSARKYLRPAP